MAKHVRTSALTSLRVGLLLAGFLILLTTKLDGRFPFFEMVTNFRPQFFLYSLLFLVGLMLARLWREALAMGAFAFVLGIGVVPYLVASPEVPDDGQVAASVLQYNILFSNRDLDAITEVVLDADADIVGLHELTATQWEVLQISLGDAYPYQLALPGGPGSSYQSRGGGKALLSKTPLTNVPVSFDLELEGTFVPPLAATTEIDGEEVLAIALHPSPSRTGAKRIFERQAKLAAVRDVIESYDGPAIVIADLNIAPTSPKYHSFLDSLNWDDPRRTVGIEPTYTLWGLPTMGLAIDHIFVSPEFAVFDYEVGEPGGSDHRSLVATIGWARSPEV